MATKKFFEIEFKGGNDLIRQIADVELQMQDLAKAIAKAKTEADKDTYKNLRVQQEDLKKSSKELKVALAESVKEFTKGPIVIAQTEKELRNLEKAMIAAQKAADKEAYNKLRQEQKELAASTKQLAKEQADAAKSSAKAQAEAAKQLAKEQAEAAKAQAKAQKEIEKQGVPTSLIAMRNEYSKLIKEVSNFTKAQRESAEGIAKIKLAGNLKKEILDIDQAMGNFTSNIGNYKSAFFSLTDILSGGFLAGGLVAVLGNIAGALIDTNKEIADLQADVRKTTELTQEEIEGLTSSLETLDTRTTTQGLLKISVIAGQLGIKGPESIFKFTSAIDKLSVALGDDFGSVEEVADKTGRLSNIFFGVTEDADVLEKRLLSIGNALNGLGAEGSATAPIITEFAARIGRSLIPLGVAPAKVLALSSAFQELNINPEQGSTAINNLIKDIGANIELFSKTLKLNSGQLETAFNTDPLEAFQIVLNKVTELSGGNNAKTLSLLKDLKQTGEGVSSVFLQLGANSELYEKRLDSANKLLKSNSSINDEYAVKNQNAAASLEKVTKSFSDFISSEGARQLVKYIADNLIVQLEGLTVALESVFDFMDRFKQGTLFVSEAQTVLIKSNNELNATLAKEQGNLDRNIETLKSATSSREAKTAAIQELNEKFPELFKNYDLEYASIGTLNKLQEEATAILRQQVFERVRLRGKELLIQKEIELAEQEAQTRSGEGSNFAQRGVANLIGTLFGQEKKLESYKQAADLIKKQRDEVLKEQEQYNERTIELATSLGIDMAKQESANVDTFSAIGTQVKSATSQIQNAIVQGRSQSNEKAVQKLVQLKNELDNVYSQVDKSDKQEELDMYLKRITAIKSQIAQITAKKVVTDDTVTSITTKADTKVKAATDKYLEEQEKRIKDNQKRLEDLSIEGINNIYDKEIEKNKQKADELLDKLIAQSAVLEAKIKSNKGIVTDEDKQESKLIAEETKAIENELDKQNKAVNEKRKEAFTNAKLQLESLQRENLKAIASLSIQDSTGNISDIKQESSRTIQTIELKYDQDQNALDNLFANNLVSQEEYTRKSKALEIGKQSERLEIEKTTNQKILDEQERLYKIQLELIKATENIAISKIDEDLFRDQEKAWEDFKAGRIASQEDYFKVLDALEDKANIDRSQVFQDTADKEKDAINTVLDAKIAADNAVIQSEANVTKNQITEAEKRKKINQEVLQASLDIAQLLSNSIFELTNQDAEREKETKLTALEEEYAKKIELAQGNKTLEEALKAELEAKKLEIEKKAFERQKKLQIAQALINAAVAATAIFTVPDFTFGIATAAKLAALAITTATSIASIKKQQFADGGKIPTLTDGKIRINPNAPTTAKGDNIVAYVKRGEVILNEEQQEAAGGPEFFRRLNVPGFAEGGRVPNITGVGSSRSGVGITDEQMMMFASIVANQTYEAVYKGSAYGASDGTFKGQQDTLLFNQQRDKLKVNTEF